jgi:hypothetical protein
VPLATPDAKQADACRGKYGQRRGLRYRRRGSREGEVDDELPAGTPLAPTTGLSPVTSIEKWFPSVTIGSTPEKWFHAAEAAVSIVAVAMFSFVKAKSNRSYVSAQAAPLFPLEKQKDAGLVAALTIVMVEGLNNMYT